MKIYSWWNDYKSRAYNPNKTNEAPFGWSNREIADALGYTTDAVQSWMSGRVMPGDDAIHDICSLLEVDEEIGAERFKKDHEYYLKMKNGNQISIQDVSFGFATENPPPFVIGKPDILPHFNDLSDSEQMEIIVQRLKGVDCDAIIDYLKRVRIAGSSITRKTKRNKLAYAVLEIYKYDGASLETTFDIYERLRDLILEVLDNGSWSTN